MKAAADSLQADADGTCNISTKYQKIAPMV